MTIRPDIFSEIKQYIDIFHIEPVRKGYSEDMKYLLTADYGESFLRGLTEAPKYLSPDRYPV